MRKPFNYATLQLGEVLGRKELVVSRELVATCADAIESPRPWYSEESPFGAAIAPPTVFDNDSLRMLDEQYERFGSIHVGQAWEFFSPTHVGSRVTLTVSVTDKFVKRDRPYLVMELNAVDENGTHLCRSTHTSLMTLEKGAQ